MPASESREQEIVIDAYQRSRRARQDEWAAFEAALAAFRRRHPETSAEFATRFVSQALRRLTVPSSEW